jgi:hypothetical protein
LHQWMMHNEVFLEFKYISVFLKRIQTKKLSTTKVNNFSRSTTLILVLSPSEVVCKI